MKEQKFRPSLTLPQIKYLISALTTATPHHRFQALHDSTLAILRTLDFKASEGITTPAYTAAPRETTEEKLGLQDPAEIKRAAYEKFLQHPELCSAKELRLAATHRYENDLMSPEEEEEFENDL